MALPVNRNAGGLHPWFAQRVLTGIQQCHAQGLMVYIFEGMRSPERQRELYDQGRKTPGKIISNAKPWQSWHNYGLAVDIVFDGESRDGIQWSWEGDYNSPKVDGVRRGDWNKIAAIFEGQGLEWAGRWTSFPEMPHFQFTGGYTTSEAYALYQQGGNTLWTLWAKILERTKMIA